MGKVEVAKNLKKRTTRIDNRGNIISQSGFKDRKEELEEKQRERAERLGLPPKENKDQ